MNLQTWCKQNNRIDLLTEWDSNKNTISIQEATTGSEKIRYWRCKLGHSYKQSIYHRLKSMGCPYCSDHAILVGFNDLQTTHPALAAEWNYDKNTNSVPTDFTAHSSYKAWWQCQKGHEWQAAIHSRCAGSGCPYCTGRLAITGVNDFQTLYPEIAKEWNFARNNNLVPSNIKSGSNRKVWWICQKGHEWQAVVNIRARLKSGCPYCSGKRAIPGETDLATLNPVLAAEWNQEKNGNLTPHDVTLSSGQKVWWKGACGHEWQALISNRNKGNGCPVCSQKGPGTKVIPGFNDLATTHPDVAATWHPAKNGSLKPSDVYAGSHRKIWWQCPNCQHEWETKIYHRCDNHGCPICKNAEGKIKKVQNIIANQGSLLDNNPELCKEWHPTKNGSLQPSDVTGGSDRPVWWRCQKCGHEWKAIIANRNKGVGCPVCCESHLEKAVRNILIAHKCIFKEQVKFDNLYGDSGKLSFDFGIFQNDAAIALIECQGEQHYRPIEWFGGVQKFQKQIEYDQKKRDFCNLNNIPLIEILYNYSAPDIEQALTTYFIS